MANSGNPAKSQYDVLSNEHVRIPFTFQEKSVFLIQNHSKASSHFLTGLVATRTQSTNLTKRHQPKKEKKKNKNGSITNRTYSLVVEHAETSNAVAQGMHLRASTGPS